MPSSTRHDQLIALARGSSWFMGVLMAVRSLGLSSWCVGAGAVRQLVWDAMHHKSVASALADVDVAHFDATDLAPQRDATLQARLAALRPDVPWEVTNQAAVHLWFEAHFGHTVAPLHSLDEAVATWPEYASCVGLYLDAKDNIGVIAPHGLDDLFACVVRRNPARVSVRTYRERVAHKRYGERWPGVTVIPS